MWVAPDCRGVGIGKKILAALEHHALEQGMKTLRLETNKSLVEAQALYRRCGYIEVKPFSDEPYAHYWFQKSLRRQTRSTSDT
jgi:ribosomal protein S18 acetylase RimI-like enzyme